MSDSIKNAMEVAGVNAEPTLAEGVSIKVADSRKCISIYGLGGLKFPQNYTLEQFRDFVDSYEAIKKFFNENEHLLLSRGERKHANQITKIELKLVKQDQETKRRQAAVQLMKQNPGMDWDSALAVVTAKETA